MFLVIDPDVFVASQTNYGCELFLRDIAANLQSHYFAVDTVEIKREYFDFWKQNRKNNPEHPVIRILTEIINGSSKQRIEIDSDYGLFKPQLNQFKCTEPVEPHLLMIVANSEQYNPVLVLPGINAAVRSRVLHDEEKRRIIQQKWIRWLDVRYAIDTSVNLPPAVIQEHASNYSKIFEYLIALALPNHIENFRCTLPPKMKTFAEQIDFFGFKNVGSVRTVIVGECKLREEGNEEKLIEYKDIAQIDRKAKAVERHYQNSQYDNFKVERYIASNSKGLNTSAIRFARELASNGTPIYFCKASLATGWSRKGLDAEYFEKLEINTIN